MSEKKCCCGGHNNSMQQLDLILEKYGSLKGALIPILQETQNTYGHLSKEGLQYIAKKTKTPISEIYGVVTFYSQFHLNPRGKHIIRVCQGTACHVRGSKAVLQKIEDVLKIKAGETSSDLKFTLETVACIGACGLAPVIMINEDTHGRLVPDSIPDILAKYQ